MPRHYGPPPEACGPSLPPRSEIPVSANSGCGPRAKTSMWAIGSSRATSRGQVLRSTSANRLEFLDDGPVRSSTPKVAHQHLPNASSPDSKPILHPCEPAVGQICAHFILMVDQLLRRGDYGGRVDAYLALSGASGAHSASWYMNEAAAVLTGIGRRSTLPDDNFRDHARVTAEKMLNEPVEVTNELVRRLARLIRPGPFPDPLSVGTPGWVTSD